ncbi:PUA domain protein [Ostertagia ostertagi]
MFRKPFSVKKNNNMRNSDVKKLLQRLPPEVGELVPKKAMVAHAKFVTFNGASLNCFFQRYIARKALPSLSPCCLVHESVLSHLENGADLMLPGVVHNQNLPMRQFNRGDVVTISIISNGQVVGPVAVGAALMSSQDMIANKFTGRGVQPLHMYRDFLWEFGSRVVPSPLDLKSLFKVEEPTETSAEEEFPPLGALSVSEHSGDVAPKDAKEEGSAPTIAEEANDGDVEEEPMDQLLYRCFLAALKYRLDQVPMDVGQFYAQCLLKCVPNGKRLEMKKTKFKKFSVFLEEANKSEDGPLVKIRKEGKGCDLIEEVFKNHPALRSFVVTDEITKDEDPGATKSGPKIYESRKMYYPCSKPEATSSKGQLLEGPQIREIVTNYVKSEELNQGKHIRLDPILAQVTRIPEDTADWNTVLQKIQSKMTKTFVLRMPDGRELIRKINMPRIVFKVETRSGNKKVTLINNLSAFGIEVKKLCHQIQVEAATSATTTNEAVNCEGPQVTVLGNHVTYLGDLFANEYGIDKKYMDGLDLGIKKKRK